MIFSVLDTREHTNGAHVELPCHEVDFMLRAFLEERTRQVHRSCPSEKSIASKSIDPLPHDFGRNHPTSRFHPLTVSRQEPESYHFEPNKMPSGCSLWLVPPPDSKLSAVLQSLITEFSDVAFPPHLTLSGDLVAPDTAAAAQAWLDGVTLPGSVSSLKVHILSTDVGDAYFRKVTFKCDKTLALAELAASCKVSAGPTSEAEAQTWAEQVFWPHVSLM